ncbi:sphingosine kinase 1 [Scaptodrosophila lebanonensis]|uniref:sphingosine kinase n=1 Tax=Drosophila lebanonensis TaxID=7225 RepID=A0A6J2U0R4_DROLE|nr:sphingosine kinase 1 [Scaptodrosophila lebanonensis]XP_030380703.1 sphingosine kinase 1 [Scaptodrosophila lebanonensis]XP_030380704.1 sphingosine kinase 1 [Scaptodrosophila lebanonensis]
MTATTVQPTQQTTARMEQVKMSRHLSQSSSCTSVSTLTTPELCEIFYVENRRKQHMKIEVRLCSQGVYLRRQTETEYVNEQLIPIEDIIGSRCGPRLKKRARGGLSSCKNPSETQNDEPAAPQADADNSAYLYIYAYLKQEKPLRRIQTLRILRFRSNSDYGSNLRTAAIWHRSIREHKMRSSSRSWDSDGKQLLILLNPKSGSGKGRELFQKQVVPLLREAEIQYELHITTHAQHAQELVRTRKDLLERFSGIIVASGDGLFYEVLNGLMERMDWRRACKELPLGIIPCGSGNGLAKSVAHHCNEPYEPKPILNSTLTCIAGRATPMDVVRVELAQRNKHFVKYSFLSVGWGLIADIDIESERLRSIGAQRFTLWAIRRLITLRTYHGKLYYLPISKNAATPTPSNVPASTDRTSDDPQDDAQCDPDVSGHLAARLSLPVNTTEFKDLADDDPPDDTGITLPANGEDQDEDQFVDALSMDRSMYRQHGDSWHSAFSRRTAYYSIAGQSMRSNCSRTPSLAQRIEAANAQFAELVPTGTMPALQLPLPTDQGWICEEGDFVMVHAAYTTHLASDCFFAPASKLNDGIIYLMVIRAGVSRSQLLNFLLSLNDGSHLPEPDDPFIRVVPVQAFRIVPSGSQGIMTVDGELVDYGAIQAEIFPGMINVMATNGQ